MRIWYRSGTRSSLTEDIDKQLAVLNWYGLGFAAGVLMPCFEEQGIYTFNLTISERNGNGGIQFQERIYAERHRRKKKHLEGRIMKTGKEQSLFPSKSRFEREGISVKLALSLGALPLMSTQLWLI